MNTENYHNLRRAFLLFIFACLGSDLIFATFALFAKETFIAIPLLWNLACIPLFFAIAIKTIIERKKEIYQQQYHNSDTQIFKDSYEKVLLDKQEHTANNVLFPFLKYTTLILILSLSIFIIYNDTTYYSNKYSHTALACLFSFKIFILYTLAKYLYGVASDASHSSFYTISGLAVFQCMILFILLTSQLLGRLDLNPKIFTYCITFFGILYCLETLLKTISSFYGLKSKQSAPETPFLLYYFIHDPKTKSSSTVFEYQFGNSITNSNFIKSKALSLALFFVITLILSTSFIQVKPGEVAIIESFGKVTQTLKSGYHIIIPWPFSNYTLIQVNEIKKINVGTEHHEKPIIWKNNHGDDETFFLVHEPKASKHFPVEDYAINATLMYKIEDPYQYTYLHANPENLIKNQLHKLLSYHLITNQHNDIRGTEKTNLETHILIDFNQFIQNHQLGIQIEHFSILQIHPPQETVESFELAINSEIEKQQTILKAITEQKKLEKKIKGLYTEKISDAQIKSAQIKNDYLGELAYFKSVYPIYELIGDNYLQFKALDQLPKDLKHMKKILVLSQHKEKVQTINLEKPLDPDILDLSLEAREN